MPSKLHPDHVTQINGRDYVLFKGLLELATGAGFIGSTTEIITQPTKENGFFAVCRVTARFAGNDTVVEGTGEVKSNDRVFTCVGDASPDTTKLKAYLRMAETRALARCLRFALAIGETAFDEMEEEFGASKSANNKQTYVPQGGQRQQEAPQGNGAEHCEFDGCGVALTPGQVKLSMGKYNAKLCPTHQREMTAVG